MQSNFTEIIEQNILNCKLKCLIKNTYIRSKIFATPNKIEAKEIALNQKQKMTQIQNSIWNKLKMKQKCEIEKSGNNNTIS